MTRISYKVTKKQAAPFLKAAGVGGQYKGRKFHFEFTDRVWFHDTNWGDGTRNGYTVLGRDGSHDTFNAPAPWVNAVEGASVPMTPDFVVIEHTIFCGQDLGYTIYAHPCYLPKWLPEAVKEE